MNINNGCKPNGTTILLIFFCFHWGSFREYFIRRFIVLCSIIFEEHTNIVKMSTPWGWIQTSEPLCLQLKPSLVSQINLNHDNWNKKVFRLSCPLSRRECWGFQLKNESESHRNCFMAFRLQLRLFAKHSDVSRLMQHLTIRMWTRINYKWVNSKQN